LYGADAVAGVVQVLTRKPGDGSVKVDLEGASHGTARASLFAGGSHGPWRGTASGEAFTTDGYTLVSEDERGAVDVPATQRYDSGRLGAGYETPGFYARVVGDVYAEHRGNGTPIQTNSTDIRQLHLDLGGTVAGGSWNVTGQTGDQSYDQAFSSIARRLGHQQRADVCAERHAQATDPHGGLSADQRRLPAVHPSAGIERHGHRRRSRRPSPALAGRGVLRRRLGVFTARVSHLDREQPRRRSRQHRVGVPRADPERAVSRVSRRQRAYAAQRRSGARVAARGRRERAVHAAARCAAHHRLPERPG
jgi:hypothetical protein